jgi:ATP-dependent RNA helicase DeaD
MSDNTPPTFADLGLSPAMLKALDVVGYEHPTPIQAQTIPLLLQGRDLIGQAQTGTGKTAAFALPLLSKLDLKQKEPQVLVLAPTRELAIQVAEAFGVYASHLKGFHVLPVYGGSDFRGQLHGLKRGSHVVVGTPGRVMDHMRRGTLDLSGIKVIVLDEADEMLRMGFIDDVEWILQQAPAHRQVALFSATMPPPIRKIANTHLKDPAQIAIELKTVSAETIRQRYWPVRGINKLDALTRILEAEPFTGMIIFVRTRTATTELSDKLAARGFAASPLNGDMSQQLRESTVDKLRKGKLDILVATDVAARGLDVERISHVVNYDIPYDVETYIHRIGRTGRAGKEGDAILFVAPREQRLLGAIEKATRKKIELMELPSTELINDRRVSRFMEQITETLADADLGHFQQLIERYESEHNVPAREIAAALAHILQGEQPLLLKKEKPAPVAREDQPARGRERDSFEGRDNSERPRRSRERDSGEERSFTPRRQEADSTMEPGMDRYRVEVGHNHEIKPGNIVGAIANEAGIESRYIGRIQIFDDHSLVDLPAGMPDDVFQYLKKIWVGKRQLNISLAQAGHGATKGSGAGKEFKKSGKATPRGEFKPGAGKDNPGKERSFKERSFKGSTGKFAHGKGKPKPGGKRERQ